MNKNITLSVIVPTRGRLETLKHTLSALLKLSNSNIEFIICDNASEDGTKAYVNNSADSRIKYFRSDKLLSMPKNFEKGLEHSTGDFILTLGDDDLIIQNNLNLALENIEKSNSDLIYWNRWYFYWSSFPEPNNSGTFGISLGKNFYKIDTNYLLILAYYGFLNYQMLPSIYNSIVKRSFLLNYKSNLRGCYFPDYVAAVDVFSSIVFSSMNSSTLYLESPVSVSGISHRSNGMSVFTDQSEFKKFISELGKDDCEIFAPDNLIGKINILTDNGRNTLAVMVDYHNALRNLLFYTMNSPPDVDLFTRNFVNKLLVNGDIEFKEKYQLLSGELYQPNNHIPMEDPVTYFYKVFNIPTPSIYTGKFNINNATSLTLFDHLQEVNFNQ